MDISFSSVGNFSLNTSGYQKPESSKKNDITNVEDLDFLATSNFLDESNFVKGQYSKVGLAIMN